MTGGEKYMLGVGSFASLALLLTGIIGQAIHLDEAYKGTGWPVALVFGGIGTIVLVVLLGISKSNCSCK